MKIVKAEPAEIDIYERVIEGELEEPTPPENPRAIVVDKNIRPYNEGAGEEWFGRLTPGFIYKIELEMYGWNLNQPVDTWEVEITADWTLPRDRPVVTAVEVRSRSFARRDPCRGVYDKFDPRQTPMSFNDFLKPSRAGLSYQGRGLYSLPDLRAMFSRRYEDLTYRTQKIDYKPGRL